MAARGRRGALRAQQPEPEEPERVALSMLSVLLSWLQDLPHKNGVFSIHILGFWNSFPFQLGMCLCISPTGFISMRCLIHHLKRACKPSETIPNEADAHLIDCAMELDSKQKISAGCCPWATKIKQNSVIFENHGSKGIAQPCPRCIAGESGHFSHILGF